MKLHLILFICSLFAGFAGMSKLGKRDQVGWIALQYFLMGAAIAIFGANA